MKKIEHNTINVKHSIKMILALDVHYKNDHAKAVGVLFNADDHEPQHIITERIDKVANYIPGQFYKRELPCLLKVIEKLDLEEVDLIIIDGYVYIDNDGRLGLGGRLWEALQQKIPVVGVAKTSFLSNKEMVTTITRGESKNPLYVSAIGIARAEAASLVLDMKGSFRIPDVLKNLDRLTKDN